MSTEKIDPLIATAFRIVGDKTGAMLVFQRPVFTAKPDGDLVPELVTSTAITVGWGLIEDIHRVLGDVLDRRAKAIDDAVRETAKPN